MRKAGRKRERLLACIGMGVGLIGPTAAHADVHFNGFGQVVVGSALDNNRPMPLGTYLGEYAADPNFRTESLFALQAQASLSESISATAQILADGATTSNPAPGQFTNDEFQPKFSWAYATWTINDNFSLKGGRQRLPLYHYSDYLQVGEAYPWIRPPVSVYSAPVSNYDGISLNGNFSFGDWFLQPQVYYGNFNGNIYYQELNANLTLDNLMGAVIDASYSDWFEFRASYHMAKMSATYDQVTTLQSGITALTGSAGNGALIAGMQEADQALVAAGAPAVFEDPNPLNDSNPVADLTAANQYYNQYLDNTYLSHQTITFSSAGISINKYNFIFDGEYVFQHSPAYILDTVAYYLSLGYHYKAFTPYITYGRDRSKIGDKGLGDRMAQENAKAYSSEAHAIAPDANGNAAGSYVNACNQANFYAALGGQPAVCSGTGGLTLPDPQALLAGLYGDAAGAPVPTLFNGGSHLVNSPNQIDDYYEIGLRYDVSRSTALKFDYTYYGSPQNATPDPGPRPSQGFQHGQLLSAAFVFTF